MKNDSELRKDCPMRHENGNCLSCGGFCMAVNDAICEALHNAYDAGWHDATCAVYNTIPPDFCPLIDAEG